MSLYISRKTEFVEAPTPAKHSARINIALKAAFVLALAAYNLIRLPKLLAAPA